MLGGRPRGRGHLRTASGHTSNAEQKAKNVRKATKAMPASCASNISSPAVIEVHNDGNSTQHKTREPKRERKNMKSMVRC